MSYREYVPTCVETLFGRPPTKFKARAIIPESKTVNMDSGGCKCCTCEKYNSPRKTSNPHEDFAGDDIQYRCLMHCSDRRKHTKKKDNGIAYREEARVKRRFKDRSYNRRVDYSHCKCYCTPQFDTEEEFYPEQRTIMKHKTNKIKNYSSEPSGSADSPGHSDSERFCSVCHLWVRCDSKEKREEYSSKKYEDRMHKGVPKESSCPKGIHFVVESCKFCGNRRDGTSESGKKGEEFCQALQSIIRSEEVCKLGRKVEQSSRSEDFFKIKELTEPIIRSNDKERDSCEEIYEMYAEEMAALERYPETPRDQDPIERNRQEDVSDTNKERSSKRDFKKAHSASEINNSEKQHKITNGDLEDYKQQLFTELKDKQRETSPQNTDFRSCDCEYTRKDWKAEKQNKPEPDKSEIRLLKQKCDEALGQLELFKREIAESKQEKCHCDMEFTMCVIEDCKHRCAQLEKQVVHLQRCIDCYTHPKPKQDMGSNWEIRQHHKVNENQKKQARRDHGSSGKRIQSREVIKANTRVIRKPKSTCSPARVRNIGCQHIRCFPQEQIRDIPAFKMCPGYQVNSQQMANKR